MSDHTRVLLVARNPEADSKLPREAIFWQTQKTARAANPGGRIPRRRALADAVTIAVDTRERYPHRFAQQAAETVRATVAAGDYAIHAPDGSLLAAVERKSLENLAATLSDGTLAFQLQRLAELPPAAVVVEARYSALFKLEHVNGSWLADQLARLEVRYPEIHLVFADSRRFAEEWAYRFPHHSTHRRDRPTPKRLRPVDPFPAHADLRGDWRESAFSTPTRSALDELNQRERDVLSLIAEGRSNKAIGKMLHLSARTVERHAQAIF
jgi:hypothetical protein